jgi:hypothetical protein
MSEITLNKGEWSEVYTVIDEYKKAAYLIKDALENIKEIYLGGKDE